MFNNGRRFFLIGASMSIMSGCSPYRETVNVLFGSYSLVFENSEIFLENVTDLKSSYGIEKITERAVKLYTFMKWKEGTDLSEIKNVDIPTYLEFIDSFYDFNKSLVSEHLTILDDSNCEENHEIKTYIDRPNVLFIDKNVILDVWKQIIPIANSRNEFIIIRVFEHLMYPQDCIGNFNFSGQFFGTATDDLFEKDSTVNLIVNILFDRNIIMRLSWENSPIGNIQSVLAGRIIEADGNNWKARVASGKMEVEVSYVEKKITAKYLIFAGIPTARFYPRPGKWTLTQLK